MIFAARWTSGISETRRCRHVRVCSLPRQAKAGVSELLELLYCERYRQLSARSWLIPSFTMNQFAFFTSKKRADVKITMAKNFSGPRRCASITEGALEALHAELIVQNFSLLWITNLKK